MKNNAIQLVATSLDLDLGGKTSTGTMQKMADKINDLLLKDFQQLISILYQMDVSEKKLKDLLKANPREDAGKIIASLMIERQVEKIKSLQKFRKGDSGIDENEKW